MIISYKIVVIKLNIMRKKTTTATQKYLYLLLNFKCHLQRKINYLITDALLQVSICPQNVPLRMRYPRVNQTVPKGQWLLDIDRLSIPSLEPFESWIGRLNAKSKSEKAELRTVPYYYITKGKKSLTSCPCDYLGWPIWCNVWKNCTPTCERVRSEQKTLHYVPFVINTTPPKAVLTDDAPYKSALPYMGCCRLFFRHHAHRWCFSKGNWAPDTA